MESVNYERLIWRVLIIFQKAGVGECNLLSLIKNCCPTQGAYPQTRFFIYILKREKLNIKK